MTSGGVGTRADALSKRQKVAIWRQRKIFPAIEKRTL
jgi:hypothetical protein